MMKDEILALLQASPVPMTTRELMAKMESVEKVDDISKAIYNLWKRGQINRRVIKGRYAYQVAGEQDNDPDRPSEWLPNSTMLSITPSPTRLTETKAQAVRRLRESVMAEATMTDEAPVPYFLTENELPVAEAPPPRLVETEVTPDGAVDLPDNPQSVGDPVLEVLARGIQGPSVRNATIHIRRLRALAIWKTIPDSVGMWLLDLAAEIEQSVSSV